MDDREALREALKQIEHDASTRTFLWCWLTAIDAARKYLRLMEGAETVWWCQTHRCSTWLVDECVFIDMGGKSPLPCRMVKADLHIRSESVEA